MHLVGFTIEIQVYYHARPYERQIWIHTFPVIYTVQTGVAAHQTSYPVSRAPYLPGRAGTAKCQGYLRSIYHQTKEIVEPCHHSPMHVYSVILGLKHKNDFNF